ncbi:helix-turn-helix transcriptional regulator [Ornithinimicrobium cerasi]|uniref:helix-turn-helix transcriptional regulator n=1 Tax=Ornithinimicrobium cerasi TaxID=2248773 RepID=UPI000EFF77B8|nr:winged helix-turn-helix domain-containing protein [Ornithinimicrobium cerasi]
MKVGWTFLSTHGQVLLAVAGDPSARVRDLAERVGISTRAVLTVLDDLERAGYVHRDRVGRRTRYTVHPELPMRHPAVAHHRVGELLDVLGDRAPGLTGERA